MKLTEQELLDLIIYRDALILILNKPSGIAVHSDNKHNNGLDKYLDFLRFGLPRKPELAHRLDKDTSGCLILGRHAQSLKTLGNLFENNKISKTYLAIVEGCPPDEMGIIDAPLAPLSDKKYQWWMKVDVDGKPSVTEYKVLKTIGDKTLLELTPKTGRTHQLRVHCAHIGCPILGDKIYGKGKKDYLYLHASTLEIPLYPKKDSIKIEAPIPEHFIKELANKL